MLTQLRKIKSKLNDSRSKKIFAQKTAVDISDITLFGGANVHNTGPKENIVIGKHCTIAALLEAKHGGKIVIGNNLYIGPGSIIQSKESVTIKDNVVVGPNVTIMDNNNHPVDPEMRLKMSACEDFFKDDLWSWKYAESKPIVIEENVWLGRDSRIMKGVTVGKGSIVALGSIVTKDVPPYTVVAGNPAKVVKNLTPPEVK